MTDDHAIFRFINFCEVSSELRLHSERAKEVGRDINAFHAFRRFGSIKIDGKRSPRGNAFEALTLLAKIEDIGRVEKGPGDAQLRISISQPDNSLRVSVWQRPNQHRKHHAEDRCIRADTERQHKSCDKDKTPTPRECPTGIPKILPGISQWSKPLNISILFIHICDITARASVFIIG